MPRLLTRASLCTAVMLQLLHPAMGWNEYIVEEPCCGEAEWGCCGPDVVFEGVEFGYVTESYVSDECGCGADAVESQSDVPAPPPEPAQSNKPAAQEAGAPPTQTPQPALGQSGELPPAPINVPTTPAAAESNSNELFPGPAAEPPLPADTEPVTSTPTNPTPTDVVPATPTTPPAASTNDNAGGIFDEPSSESPPVGTEPAASAPPVSEPATSTPAPATESAPPASAPVDDVFGEPTPPAEESADPTSVEVPAEGESTEADPSNSEGSDEPAADPLDDLFGPSSAVETPKSNQEVATPSRVRSGLASAQYRQWSSRAGEFQCEGRLLRLSSEGVFVEFSGGNLVAIAYSQLSDSDLAFVRAHIQAQRAVLAQEATSQVASH